jgi:hypothetical protein
MFATSKNQKRANNSSTGVTRDAHEELIRAVQEMNGKDCFATELAPVCPDIYCRWKDDCLKLSLG